MKLIIKSGVIGIDIEIRKKWVILIYFIFWKFDGRGVSLWGVVERDGEGGGGYVFEIYDVVVICFFFY